MSTPSEKPDETPDGLGAPPPPARYNFGPVMAPVAAGTAPPILAPASPPRPAAMPVPALAHVAPAPVPRLKNGALPAALAALALGFAADALFWGQMSGVNVPLFVGLLLAALAALSGREGARLEKRNLLFLAPPLAFFSLMIAVRASASLTALNVLTGVLLVALIASFGSGGGLSRLGVGGLLGAPFVAFGAALGGGVYLTAQAAGETRVDAGGRKKAGALLRGLLLAAPVVLVFGALLVSADAVFERLVSDLAGRLVPSAEAETLFGRAVGALSVAFLVGGGFFRVLAGRRRAESDSEARSSALAGSLGFTEGMVVLGSVAALFAAFVAVQFAYLFGGAGHVLSAPGLTYAEYARRGFAELNWTAVLTLALIGGLRGVTRREGVGQANGFRATATLLLGLTLLLLASAFQRMTAYEAAYGATETRLYVDGFIVWLGVAVVWFGATLWRESLGFGIGAFGCALGFAATMNAVNPDAVIAARNGVRYLEAQPAPSAYGRGGAVVGLDSCYMAGLSDDSVPAQLALLRRLPAGSAAKSRLGDGLAARLRRMRETEGEHAWPSANLARSRARQLLEQASKELPQNPSGDGCR